MFLKYIRFKFLELVDVTLFGKSYLYRCDSIKNLEMRKLSWINQRALKAITSIPTGVRERKITHTRRLCNDGTERNLETLSLKIGVMWPQTKECQQLPEAGGGKEQILPRASKGNLVQ